MSVEDSVVTNYSSRLPHEILIHLLSSSPYQEMWGQFVKRRRGPGVNARAVASFIAAELSDSAGEEISPEYLKDSVRRALTGKGMSDRTLRFFVTAFDFEDEETQELYRSVAYEKQLKSSPHSGIRPDQPRDKEDKRSNLFTSLAETLEVSCDKYGLITGLIVEEVVIAEQDHLEYISPFYETLEADLEILEGGSLEKVVFSEDKPARADHHESYQLMIRTPYPLRRGEIHRLKTRVKIHETHEDNPSTNYVQLGTFQSPKYNVTLKVLFEQEPEELYSCVWEDQALDTPAIEQKIEGNKSHHSLFFPIIDKAYCGFTWSVRPAEN